MCLSVPMKVEETDGLKARCSALGEERWTDLTLMADAPPKVGDYIIVHLKFAQRIVSEKEALEAYLLFNEILSTLDGTTSNG
ncbi:MAG: HypC/HybG/HupF family hydrogenase formation chaperone [Rhodospirillales bacterium]|nr:HypC/HybG/HupF family hydrogenase formation chaperone [Rhodospirillales bacterium]